MEPNNLAPEVGCEFFEVSGVRYTRLPADQLPLSRAILLQRFQTELQYNMSIPDVQRRMMEVAAALNGNKLLDGLHKFGQLLDGLDILGTNRYREAEICSLFYLAPGEDAASTDYQTRKDKVQAWGAVPAAFFLRTAFALLVNFYEACQPAPAPTPSAS